MKSNPVKVGLNRRSNPLNTLARWVTFSALVVPVPRTGRGNLVQLKPLEGGRRLSPNLAAASGELWGFGLDSGLSRLLSAWPPGT